MLELLSALVQIGQALVTHAARCQVTIVGRFVLCNAVALYLDVAILRIDCHVLQLLLQCFFFSRSLQRIRSLDHL